MLNVRTSGVSRVSRKLGSFRRAFLRVAPSKYRRDENLVQPDGNVSADCLRDGCLLGGGVSSLAASRLARHTSQLAASQRALRGWRLAGSGALAGWL